MPARAQQAAWRQTRHSVMNSRRLMNFPLAPEDHTLAYRWAKAELCITAK